MYDLCGQGGMMNSKKDNPHQVDAVVMQDGMIAFGSKEAGILGLTPDKFDGTWLWKDGNTIIISFIISKAKGNFKALITRIRSLGFAVEIPTPLGRMQEIVIKNGYRHEIKNSEMGPVDVWILDA